RPQTSPSPFAGGTTRESARNRRAIWMAVHCGAHGTRLSVAAPALTQHQVEMRVTEETQIISGGFMRRRLAPKLLDWARMAAPFLILAIILYATHSPLNMRPRTQFPVHFEHFAAFAVLGALYAIAFPRRILLVLLTVVLAAAGLE